MNTLKIIIGLVAFIAIMLGLELAGVHWYRFIAPQKENARREVFEQTKSYNEGKTQQLAKYKIEYDLATNDDEKEAIAAGIRGMFADYDAEKLPHGLNMFLVQIRGY